MRNTLTNHWSINLIIFFKRIPLILMKVKGALRTCLLYSDDILYSILISSRPFNMTSSSNPHVWKSFIQKLFRKVLSRSAIEFRSPGGYASLYGLAKAFDGGSYASGLTESMFYTGWF